MAFDRRLELPWEELNEASTRLASEARSRIVRKTGWSSLKSAAIAAACCEVPSDTCPDKIDTGLPVGT